MNRRRLMLSRFGAKGGLWFRTCTPPSPTPDAPQFSNRQLHILAWDVGAKGAEIFSLYVREKKFFPPHVCLLKMLQVLWRFQICMKRIKKILQPFPSPPLLPPPSGAPKALQHG